MNSQVICKSVSSFQEWGAACSTDLAPRCSQSFSPPPPHPIKPPLLGARSPGSWEKEEKAGVVDTGVPGEPGWPEGEGRGRNAKGWLPPQTPDPPPSSGRPVGSQPQCSPEPAAWQHRGHREGEGDPMEKIAQAPPLSADWLCSDRHGCSPGPQDMDRVPKTCTPPSPSISPRPQAGPHGLAAALSPGPQQQPPMAL